MPTYEHICEKCNHEWEEAYKINDPIPNKCPECKTKNKVKRLISWSAGSVVLTGRENVIKQWNEGKRIAKEAKKSEKLEANILGESQYHQQQLAIDKLNKL